MTFNVRLSQQLIYEDAVTAEDAEEAVRIAKERSRHDPLNWTAKNPPRLEKIEPAPMDEDEDLVDVLFPDMGLAEDLLPDDVLLEDIDAEPA